MENNSGEKPFVSIIIPTWREAVILSKCLDSLFGQDYPKDKYEIILIANKKIDISDGRVKIIYGVDYANSRNAGAKIAKGEISAFVDDDCIIPKDWISKAAKYFQDEKISIVGGPALPFEKEKLPYRIGGYLLQSSFSAGFATSRYKILPSVREVQEYNLLTANNFVRKSAFEKIAGFDTSQVPAEESNLYFRTKKAGYKLLYAPDVFVWHRAKPIFLPLSQKIFFYSSGRGLLLARKPEAVKLVYLIPTIFVLTIFFLAILSLFSNKAFYALLAIMDIYLAASLFNAFYIFLKFERNILVFFYSIPAAFLMHFSYGLGLLCGFFKYFSGTAKKGISPKSKY